MHYIVAGLAAVVTASGLITAAPPAHAGCQNADWPEHALAQMCDEPIDSDGMWERCLTYYPGGSPIAQTNCYVMSAGQPPPGDPILGTPPTHIDP
jgi:hypothetical protein